MYVLCIRYKINAIEYEIWLLKHSNLEYIWICLNFLRKNAICTNAIDCWTRFVCDDFMYVFHINDYYSVEWDSIHWQNAMLLHWTPLYFIMLRCALLGHSFTQWSDHRTDLNLLHIYIHITETLCVQAILGGTPIVARDIHIDCYLFS